VKRYLTATVAWTLAIGVVWTATGLLVSTADAVPWHDLIEVVAFSLALCSFAGGLASVRASAESVRTRYAKCLVASGLVGILVCLLIAYAAPITQYRAEAATATEARYPHGPRTPSALRMLRTDADTLPAAGERPSVDDPASWSASWVDYYLVRPRATGALAVLNAALGILAALLTIDLRFGTRRRVRWAIGLMSAASFMVVDDVVRSQLINHPAGSGALRGWSVLLPHIVIVAVGVLVVWARRRVE
jgi:hypothetical protein